MASNYFRKLTASEGIPFMDGRSLGKVKNGDVYHIDDFAFLNGRNGEYAVFTVKENSEEFFFGGLVLTDILHRIDQDGMREELKNQGVVFGSRQSKNDRTRHYTTVDFVD